MYIFDEQDPRPVLEAMYQVDRLIDLCERQRDVAWAHLEPDWFEDDDTE